VGQELGAGEVLLRRLPQGCPRHAVSSGLPAATPDQIRQPPQPAKHN
jgi:hypothetical protein